MKWSPPTLADVLRARAAIAPYLRPTPTIERPALDAALGCRAHLKCENLNPTGAFKVRGGINLLSTLDDEQRARGVLAASTGNHAQSIAYAARLFGIRAVIYMPEAANPMKVAATRAFGAEVVLVGRDFDEARRAGEARAGGRGCATSTRPTSRCWSPAWRPARWSCSRSRRTWTSSSCPWEGEAGPSARPSWPGR